MQPFTLCVYVQLDRPGAITDLLSDTDVVYTKEITFIVQFSHSPIWPI